MHQVHPDAALVPFLKRITVGDLRIHIYTNDVTPDEDTVLGDLDDGDPSGLATATVAEADWIFDGVAAHRGYLQAAPIDFVKTGGGTANAYGYYVTDADDTVLLACARFDGAPFALSLGQFVTVWPTLGDKSRFAS